eukprot:GEZU01029307.1.p1 GENE.GEZU01029307.1~~GEZU01029307.1.p1  ORF type:complete len:170 (-),score=11.01 GEZU01029307.1:221-730(-)
MISVLSPAIILSHIFLSVLLWWWCYLVMLIMLISILVAVSVLSKEVLLLDASENLAALIAEAPFAWSHDPHSALTYGDLLNTKTGAFDNTFGLGCWDNDWLLKSTPLPFGSVDVELLWETSVETNSSFFSLKTSGLDERGADGLFLGLWEIVLSVLRDLLSGFTCEVKE